MKHNRNHDNAPNASAQLVPVHFTFDHPTAKSVCLAGTFNEWHPTTKAMQMQAVGSGHWQKEAFLPPGDYEYCLVVDGQWMPDPLALKTVPNPYGGKNSILNVARSPEAAHRAAAQNLPLKNTNKKNPQRL
jgi:1,4-alpha-glucan branching enzyme